MSRQPFPPYVRWVRIVLSIIVSASITASVAASPVKFVQPLNGSQTFGPMWIEITTDAANVDRVEFSVDGTLAGVAKHAPWRITYDFGSSLSARTVTARVFSNQYKTVDTATVKTAALTAA